MNSFKYVVLNKKWKWKWFYKKKSKLNEHNIGPKDYTMILNQIFKA